MQAFYKDANNIMEQAAKDYLNFLIDTATIATVAEDIVTTEKEPKNLNVQSQTNKNMGKAIIKDFYNMTKQQVATKSIMPPNHMSVMCKWVLNITYNDVHQSTMVVCRCGPLPGLHFSESYFPVVNDIIFRALLLIMIKYGWLKLSMYELEEEIYTECLLHVKDKTEVDFINSTKHLYSLIQTAWQ